jgi:hypothetical protein
MVCLRNISVDILHKEETEDNNNNNNNNNCMAGGGTKVRIPAKARLFFCCLKSPTLAVSQQASYSLGTAVISEGVKRPGPDGDHSATSSTNVKNEQTSTSAPSTDLQGAASYSVNTSKRNKKHTELMQE